MIFHLVMTVSTPTRAMVTIDRVLDLEPGVTRAKVYSDARNYLTDKIGTSNFNTLFFSLEKDDLAI